jgi:predicted acylesterase/phospholipase RssA
MPISPDPPQKDAATDSAPAASATTDSAPAASSAFSRLTLDQRLKMLTTQQQLMALPDWVNSLPKPEYVSELNEAAVPIILLLIAIVGVAVIVPIVRIVQALTAVGFGWALGWMITGLIVAALWLLHELRVLPEEARSSPWGIRRRRRRWVDSIRTGLAWYATSLRLIAFGLIGLAVTAAAALFAVRQPYVALTVAVAGILLATHVNDPDRIPGWLMVNRPRQPFGGSGSGFDWAGELAKSFNTALLPTLLAPLITWLIARSWSMSAGLLIVVVGCAFYFVARGIWRHPPSRTSASVLLIIVTSLGFSWFLLSALHSWRTVVSSAIPSAAARKTEIERRIALQAGWNGPRVAVALSGGGYRAALTHAGLLSTLDEARIPVHILSTVSGGSIVGGSYAAGWTPVQFHRYLASTRPGLPLDVLHAGNILKRVISQRHGSGETFASHLARNYFADIALDDAGPPTLIVNATNFMSGTRASFWPHQLHPAPDLAHLVAASGAFPGAFDPVYLGDEPYVDGGVMENLGVDGLFQYLTDPTNASEPTPSVLIVSDVSAEPAAPASGSSPPLLASILRAEDLIYQRLHARIFASYTGSAYQPSAPSRIGYEVDAGSLWPGRTGRVLVFIVSPTVSAERNRLSKEDQEAAQMVADISTLFEPSPAQVNAAFWLGAYVARSYLPGICSAAGRSDCPTLAAPERPRAVP